MIADNSSRTRPTWWTYSLIAAFFLTALCLPVCATTPIATAAEAPDGNSSAAQQEKLQWGSELDGFKVRAEIEKGLWTEGKSSPLVSAFVKYSGPKVTVADYLNNWLLEIDGTPYQLMIMSWGCLRDGNLAGSDTDRADRSFGIADLTHKVSLRFALASDGESFEVQRIENGSVVNMYALYTVNQKGIGAVASPPELVPGKHTLKIGFPVFMANALSLLHGTKGNRVEEERKPDRWAMSNPIAFTIARQGKRDAKKGNPNESGRKTANPTPPRHFDQ